MHHLCYWNNEILTPIQKYAMEGAGQTAFKKLKVLLDRMMLRWVIISKSPHDAPLTALSARRTKIERADDLGLPPRTIVVRRDYFSPEEKELYLGLFTQTQRQFSTYVSTGTVLNSEHERDGSNNTTDQTSARLLEHLLSHHADASNGMSSRSRSAVKAIQVH